MSEILHLILVAAGSSSRFGKGDKLLADLNGAPVFVHALRRLTPVVTGKSVIVVPPGRIPEFRDQAFPFTRDLDLIWCEGGSCRSESVACGIAALKGAKGIAAVHDAARPLADGALLQKLYEKACEHGCAIPGKAVTDTLWKETEAGFLDTRVDREGLFAVETPQVFNIALWEQAGKNVSEKEFTDETGLFRAAGFQAALVINPDPNIKLTTQADLLLLRALI